MTSLRPLTGRHSDSCTPLASMDTRLQTKSAAPQGSANNVSQPQLRQPRPLKTGTPPSQRAVSACRSLCGMARWHDGGFYGGGVRKGKMQRCSACWLQRRPRRGGPEPTVAEPGVCGSSAPSCRKLMLVRGTAQDSHIEVREQGLAPPVNTWLANSSNNV